MSNKIAEPKLIGKTLKEAFKILKENPKMMEVGKNKNQMFVVAEAKNVNLREVEELKKFPFYAVLTLFKTQAQHFIYNIVEKNNNYREPKDFEISFDNFDIDLDYLQNWVIINVSKEMKTPFVNKYLPTEVMVLTVIEQR